MSLAPDRILISLLTAASICAVCIPLWRGFRICLRARGATRHLKPPELRSRLKQAAAPGEPLAVLMARVYQKGLRESQGQPTDFVLDASRQYAASEYDAHYASMISMYANLLPPLGFIGTTVGMLVLFVSMHLQDAGLELGALAVALLSSIFALMGFATLESFKILMHSRLLRALDAVAQLPVSSPPRSGGAAPAGAPASPER